MVDSSSILTKLNNLSELFHLTLCELKNYVVKKTQGYFLSQNQIIESPIISSSLSTIHFVDINVVVDRNRQLTMLNSNLAAKYFPELTCELVELG